MHFQRIIAASLATLSLGILPAELKAAQLSAPPVLVQVEEFRTATLVREGGDILHANPSPTSPEEQLPVFPGAVGFGTTTPAGRGGAVWKVTNLNDSGPGSLRAAVAASGPRIVVFEVSGRIKLASDLTISNPYITIAGQTAPSPGIQVTERTLEIKTHDVLIQHIRVRPGDEYKESGAWDSLDSVRIIGSGTYNVVLDHVTANWSIDGTLDITSNAQDITVSNCMITEPLTINVHSKGKHAFLSLIKSNVHRISLIRNFMGNAQVRFPLFAGGSLHFANNLIYNSSSKKSFSLFGSFDYDSVPTKASFVNNVYVKGPSGTPKTAIGFYQSVASGSAIYAKGNTYNAGPVTDGSSYYVASPPTNTWPSDFVAMHAAEVRAYVLANVGARPAERDAVEKRLISEFNANTGRLVNSQRDVGGFPNYPLNTRTFDAGPNPGGDDDGDGYTNVEEILHQMAAQVEGRT